MSRSLFQALQYQAGRGPDSLSRRNLLQTAIFAASGLLSFEYASAAPPRQLPRIVVVGAGFAGLACADELATWGYPVTVVEARNRVGGRVHTLHDLIPGKTIEGGGELVGPNQPTWMAYAKRFGLQFTDLPWDPSDVIYFGDEALKPAAARRLWNEMRSALEKLNEAAEKIHAHHPWHSPNAQAIDQQSLDDWIRALNAEPHCKELITIQMTGINGLIPAWQSLLGILAVVRGGGLQKFWDETDTMHCVGGTQQLADKLAQSFSKTSGAKKLRLNVAAHAIRVRSDKVIVELSDGTTLETDDVVLTVPPTTWNKIAFEPALPPQLVVPLAASAKYLAVFKKPIWRELSRQPNAMSDGPIQLTWETSSGQGDKGQHAIVAYAGGRAADEFRGWTHEQREFRVREELERFFPGAKQVFAGGRFVDWVSDPWARGTYSFPAPGQVMTVGPLLTAGHHQHLHFAGEYNCYAFTGWMEGALDSGVRTARQFAVRDGLLK